MSQPVNFLDLIKNPNKIQNQNRNQAQNPSQATGSKVKQPPSANDVQRNDRLEMQKSNQQSIGNQNNNIQTQPTNPYQNNASINQRQSNQQSYQQPQQQKNLNNPNQDEINQSTQRQQQSLQQQIPQSKQSLGRLGEDSVNYRPSNQQNSREANIKQNLQNSQDISNKSSTQYHNINADKNTQQQRNIPEVKKTVDPKQNNLKNSSVLSSTSQNKGVYSKQELLKTKYSLQQQQQSKQDYMKLFSQIVKEYSDDENKYYDANKTKLSIKFLYFFIAILLIMVFFDVLASRTPKFCNNGDRICYPSSSSERSNDCNDCPKDAECKNCIMRCKNGYIQKGYTCELDPTLISNSESFIIDKIKNMQYENGFDLCLNQDSSYISKPEKTINLKELITELGKVAPSKKGSIEQIIALFAKNQKNQNDYEFKFEKDVLSTSRIRFTLFCRCKYLIQTNQRALIVSLIALVILIILGFYIKSKINQMLIADEIYNELISQIQQSSDKQINISYYKEGIVNRYKSDFNEAVWVLVDKKRFNEGKINVFRDYDGIYWSYI